MTKIVPDTPPAPEGQQAPPTRAAASDSWGSRSSARGSLPLTSGTASQRAKTTDRKKDNPQCFYEGYSAGRRGELMRSPYPAGTHESWSWTGGWIEGDECRRKDSRKLDPNRKP